MLVIKLDNALSLIQEHISLIHEVTKTFDFK